MSVFTLTYCNRATGAEEELGVFHTAAHARIFAQEWAVENLSALGGWREHPQPDGDVWYEAEEHHAAWIPQGRGLHRFVIRPVTPALDDTAAQAEVIGNEEPGSFFA